MSTLLVQNRDINNSCCSVMLIATRHMQGVTVKQLV